MIILIDNYDSFTFNIFHYLSEIGAKVIVFRNDKISTEELFKMKPKAIVISPGPNNPDQAGICLDVIKKNRDTPILGICLGHQSIGQSYGGSVVLCKEIMHGKIDTMQHSGHELFNGVNKDFQATRYHSLILEKETLPSDLEIIAETKNKIIMGIAHKNKKIFGLQFHPESIGTEAGKTILGNFLSIIKYEYK
jgi:anthranilate synthase/aminodeoxychorismate synthase-like glutamine amidotransferase